MGRSLRALRLADAPLLLDWRNRPAVSRFMFTEQRIAPEEHEAWIGRALERGDAHYWIMRLGDSDVGFVSVTDIDLRQQTCSWALYVAEDSARGHGMGAFATYSVLCHVFDQLGLRKLSCEVLAFNTVALGLYERFGFVREGCFREHILKPEGAVDVFRMAILAREWEGAKEEHRQRLTDAGVLTG